MDVTISSDIMDVNTNSDIIDVTISSDIMDVIISSDVMDVTISSDITDIHERFSSEVSLDCSTNTTSIISSTRRSSLSVHMALHATPDGLDPAPAWCIP